MGPGEPAEPVRLVNALGVPEVLHDLERVPEREDLRLRDVLDEVGEQLQVTVVVESDAEGIRRLLLGLVNAGAERAEPGLDLDPVAPESVLEVEVSRRVRVRELVAHDEIAVLRVAVQRVPRRVGPAVLHRLQHPRHLVADRMLRSVAIDDPCYSAHFTARSRQNVEVFVHVPVGDGRAVALPLVPLVVHEHTVHLAR